MRPSTEHAKHHLSEEANHVLLRAVVVWEVAIKRSLGKLAAPEEYLSLLFGAGVQALAVSIDHAAAVERRPPRHRDPFDRRLIAQAGIEGAALVSRDDALRPYEVRLIR